MSPRRHSGTCVAVAVLITTGAVFLVSGVLGLVSMLIIDREANFGSVPDGVFPLEMIVGLVFMVFAVLAGAALMAVAVALHRNAHPHRDDRRSD